MRISITNSIFKIQKQLQPQDLIASVAPGFMAKKLQSSLVILVVRSAFGRNIPLAKEEFSLCMSYLLHVVCSCRFFNFFKSTMCTT